MPRSAHLINLKNVVLYNDLAAKNNLTEAVQNDVRNPFSGYSSNKLQSIDVVTVDDRFDESDSNPVDKS
ncbi:uncharacterized protein ASCRUDRAFT_8755 [Ascoidea rubescens DSM 1968]|uniref:Uncharacterized protein n=1 Tax=Ascoidea rubescens DSM 1968 TaxID=1344418 RepID=A0A1D2VFV0_9ASCO|nr:hypothetical protein ASCRUDRAFT_8755 [Ascoidea rubescens DSM 1968]ODV60554.1 hypothetical protein ASCRUDRAFT_8755 [Ascoidea rubescens DSM 1968]